jgi:hypothetical protein
MIFSCHALFVVVWAGSACRAELGARLSRTSKSRRAARPSVCTAPRRCDPQLHRLTAAPLQFDRTVATSDCQQVYSATQLGDQRLNKYVSIASVCGSPVNYLNGSRHYFLLKKKKHCKVLIYNFRYSSLQ